MWLWLSALFLQLLGFAVLLLVLLASYKFFFRSKPPTGVQKSDWSRDVVYLYQFPLCPSVRTISPFALKLETWLRVSNIKYENIFSMKFHPKTGLIPYIELNGESFSDSNIIIEKLKKEFNITSDENLSREQLAMSHAATSMVENFTAQTGFHYRYGYNMARFVEVLQLGEYYNNPKSVKNWARFQPYVTKVRNHFSGLGREENSTVWMLSSKDLKALSSWLGEKEYFHGGSEPSTVDCMIFGHLAQFLYIDIGFPQRTFLETECNNLVELVKRMKEKYWQDWDKSIEDSREFMKKKNFIAATND